VKLRTDRLVYHCYDCGNPYAASFAEIREADSRDEILECPWCDGGNDPADHDSPESSWEIYLNWKYPTT